MTRHEMEQCRTLRQDIRSIEIAMKSPKSTVVTIFYKDYRTGKGIPKSMQGMDSGEEELRILKGSLTACKRKLVRQLAKAEKFIETVEDGETRAVLRLYYIAGWSQEDVGKELHYSQSRISQIITTFWLTQRTVKTHKH